MAEASGGIDTPFTHTQSCTYDISSALPLIISDAYNYMYGPSDVPIEQIDASGVVTYLHTDELGSVLLATDAPGQASAQSRRIHISPLSVSVFAPAYPNAETRVPVGLP